MNSVRLFWHAVWLLGVLGMSPWTSMIQGVPVHIRSQSAEVPHTKRAQHPMDRRMHSVSLDGFQAPMRTNSIESILASDPKSKSMQRSDSRLANGGYSPVELYDTSDFAFQRQVPLASSSPRPSRPARKSTPFAHPKQVYMRLGSAPNLNQVKGNMLKDYLPMRSASVGSHALPSHRR
jgi:hypothetical protein